MNILSFLTEFAKEKLYFLKKNVLFVLSNLLKAVFLSVKNSIPRNNGFSFEGPTHLQDNPRFEHYKDFSLGSFALSFSLPHLHFISLQLF